MFSVNSEQEEAGRANMEVVVEMEVMRGVRVLRCGRSLDV